jgi:predicted enzyme related to lactoylglutathione lyase
VRRTSIRPNSKKEAPHHALAARAVNKSNIGERFGGKAYGGTFAIATLLAIELPSSPLTHSWRSVASDDGSILDTMMLVRAVMFFVSDPEQACSWWAEHLAPGAKRRHEGPFWWFEDEGVEVGFHPEDLDLNPQGRSTVVYWRVDNLDERRQEYIDAGCVPHRGPLAIEPGRRICQLIDPFGNCFGLDES